MAFTYSGTRITGTSKSGKVFPHSGVAKAKYGETYFNTSTGAVYKCVDEAKGSPRKAKWAYVRTEKTAPPTVAVTSLKLVRNSGGSRTMKGTWKVPKSLVSSSSKSRATGLKERWVLDTSAADGSKNKSKKDIIDKESTKNENATSCSENLNGFKYKKGKSNVTVTRSSFYPLTRKLLYSVTLTVAGYNSKGTGKKASKTFAFKPPRKPTVSALSFDASTGVVSCTIETDEGEDEKERYDTYYEVRVIDQVSGTDATVTGSSTATSIPVSRDLARFQQLKDDQYMAVMVRAKARGYAGDSEWAGWSTYYVSRPKPVSLGEPSNDGLVRCPVTVSQPTGFPVDGVKLEMLRNVTYKTPAAIPANAAWAETGVEDNGSCLALAAAVEGLKPQTKGRRTYLRVKAWHGGEVAALTSYSNVVEAPVYEPPAAADNECTITDASIARADGTSATVVVAWDKLSYTGDEDTTSMQLSWSDDPDAWTSTEEPSKFEFSWSDETAHESASEAWGSTATVKVKGLTPETDYYFRARCVSKDDSTQDASYGEWCAPFRIKTTTISGDSTSEPSVVLSAPLSVPAGSGIAFTWVVCATGEQTSWELFRRHYEPTTDEAISDGKTYYSLVGGEFVTVAQPDVADIESYYILVDTILAAGEGAEGGCMLSPDRIGEVAEGGVLECAVRSYVGGSFLESDHVYVAIAKPPSLILSASDLTAQPFSFDVECDTAGCGIMYAIKAEAVTGDEPDGSISQVEGDTVNAASITPAWSAVEWANSARYEILSAQADAAQAAADAISETLSGMEEGDDGYANLAAQRDSALASVDSAQAAMSAGGTAFQATIALDSNMEFHDGGTYSVSATATDSATGLKSESVSASFSVAWAHQAQDPPTGGFTLTADEMVQEGKTYFEYSQDADDYIIVANPNDEDLAGYYEYVESIVLTPEVSVDDDGSTTRSVAIQLAPPQGALDTDVYDVYRGTHDGVQLIGAGYASNAVVTDVYAPFGDAGDYFYRISMRTVDGDQAWFDFNYFLEGSSLRFDWDGNFVELPYNLGISDSFTKDVEIRHHLDGTSEAYFNEGVERKASLSSDIIRLRDTRTEAAVRNLAQHPGTVFVRTPNGSAFEADVEVSGLDVNGPSTAVAFDAQQVDSTGSFDLPRPLTEGEQQ